MRAAPPAQVVANNVRRLMAKHGITYDQVVEACGLDHRTVRGIARGEKRPHAKTLHRLAEGLGVTPDELFVDAASISQAAAHSGLSSEFDEATNPAVSRVVETHAELFQGWSSADYAELFSRFGKGGELTEQGAMEAAHALNHKRRLLARARVVLESSDGELLAEMIEMLYKRVQVTQ